jgi:hypothetical protein
MSRLVICCLIRVPNSWIVYHTNQVSVQVDHIAPDDLTPIAYRDHIATINLATSLSSASPDRMNLRLVRASQYLQQFRLLVNHKAGKLNHIAGVLSRLPAVGKAEPREDDDLDALHVDSASDLTLPGATPTWDVPDEAYALLTSFYRCAGHLPGVTYLLCPSTMRIGSTRMQQSSESTSQPAGCGISAFLY